MTLKELESRLIKSYEESKRLFSDDEKYPFCFAREWDALFTEKDISVDCDVDTFIEFGNRLERAINRK